MEIKEKLKGDFTLRFHAPYKFCEKGRRGLPQKAPLEAKFGALDESIILVMLETVK